MNNFKIANDFNIYVLNDHSQSNVDSEGRVAVTNNATYSNYGIGNTLISSTTRPDLVVGGKMNILSGTNFNGNSVISDINNVINYTMTNNNGVLPQPIQDSPIDFNTQNDYLRCASLNWSLLVPNGTAKVEYGGLTLTGNDPNLNIFSINGNNIDNSGLGLANLNKIDIVAPNNSTILINVSGTSLGFGNYGMFRNGITATGNDGQYILFNLYECTNISAGSTSVKGSLLAPYATYDSSYTNIEGTIMVYNLFGNIEAHNYPFIGSLPDVCSDTTESTTSSTTTESTTSSSTTESTTSSTTTESTTSSSTTESTTSSSTTESTTSSSTTESTTSSSTTESTTSSSTTESTTSTFSTTTENPCAFYSATNNIINSVAQEQEALATIISAESEKIKFATENCKDCKELICINNSVESMLTTITNLEIVLQNKIKTTKNMCKDC